MNCEAARNQLSAWLDQELEPADRAQLEAHLQTCAACRGEASRLRDLDGDLGRAFELPRAAAAHVAEQLIATLPRPTAPVETAFKRPRGYWLSMGLAMAIGFLLALLVFSPWKSRQPPVRETPKQPSDVAVRGPQPAAPVATLVLTTGAPGVEFRKGTQTNWQSVAEPSTFQCPSEGAIRTNQDARCELLTADGCVVRMNRGTEVVFHSAGKVELKRGDIWCRSTPQAPLEVRPSLSTAIVEPTLPLESIVPFSCTASDATCLLSVADSGDKVSVTAEAGNVSVKARDENLQLKPSQTATITRERVEQVRSSDRLLAMSWIQPLLVLKGHADPELAARVDDLLAQVGASKVSYLYEEEIRRLGEYGVLPLLRYVESPRSNSDGERRLVAMRIASDLAPAWAIGDLIGLLKHPDADVRCLAATALERLTQQNQGLASNKWRDPTPTWQPALLAWQEWWARNRERYPLRLNAAPQPSPPLHGHAGENRP